MFSAKFTVNRAAFPNIYHLGRACLELDRRAIQSNIAFIPGDQASIQYSGRGVDTDHSQRYRNLMIRVYDTPALIKGVWIFNPEGMGFERISMEHAGTIKDS